MNEHAAVIYGTHFPNRLFVGCLPNDAIAVDLGAFFSRFGKVIEAKVIMDDFGRSKKFGFISFQNETSVQKVLEERPIYFKGKLINVGPAVKKDGTESITTVGSDITSQIKPVTANSSNNRQPLGHNGNIQASNVPSNQQSTSTAAPTTYQPMYISTLPSQYALQIPVIQAVQHNQHPEMIFNMPSATQIAGTNSHINNAFQQSSQAFVPSQASYVYNIGQQQSTHSHQPSMGVPLMESNFSLCGRTELTVGEALKKILKNNNGNDFTRYDPCYINSYNVRYNCVY